MSNLDDFFKKRDKKKKTAKSKFSTLDTDEFAKQLEATVVKSVEDDPEGFQEASEPKLNSGNLNENLDEEWKPFDSDENKDYSGLRINIQNWKVEDEENENTGADDDNEKKPTFSWGVSASSNNNKQEQDESSPAKNLPKPGESSEQPAAATESTTTTTETSDKSEATKSTPTTATETTATSTTTTSTTGGAYIPPALRRQQQQAAPDSSKTTTKPAETTTSTTSKYIPPSLRNKGVNDSANAIPPTSVNYRRPNKSQPNIDDTLEFPTLDAAVTDNSNSDKTTNGTSEKFDFPKRVARVEQKSKDNSIDLENKFTALSSSNN